MFPESLLDGEGQCATLRTLHTYTQTLRELPLDPNPLSQDDYVELSSSEMSCRSLLKELFMPPPTTTYDKIHWIYLNPSSSSYLSSPRV